MRVTGCTVHLVDDELDDGPIVAQAAVEVRDDDTLETLEARIHEAEHRLYPAAVRRFLDRAVAARGPARSCSAPRGEAAPWLSARALEAVVFDAGGTLVRLDFEWMAETAARARRARVDAADAAPRRGRGAPPLRRERRRPRRPRRAVAAARQRRRHARLLRRHARGRGRAGARCRAVLRALRSRASASAGCGRRPMEGAREALDASRALGLRRAVRLELRRPRRAAPRATAACATGSSSWSTRSVVGIEKPDPRIFAIALDRLGVARGARAVRGRHPLGGRGGRARGRDCTSCCIDPVGDYARPGAPRSPAIAELPAWIARQLRPARGATRTPTRADAGVARGRTGTGALAMLARSGRRSTAASPRSSCPGLTPWRRGKVRSVYEAGPDHLVIVASDRLSAYDSRAADADSRQGPRS